MTHPGIVDQFGLVIIRAGDQLYLSAAGTGDLFRILTSPI
ncbi:hypothetical protein I552_9871 [Mycobacterium xenopi 3993]|nr:hypothetical protein I552_9871 [Mycobacterium xenopi 3993]